MNHLRYVFHSFRYGFHTSFFAVIEDHIVELQMENDFLPPMNVILVRHWYFNNVTGRQQLSTPSNVQICHVHVNFDPNKVEVPKLLRAHWVYIVQTFGLTLT